MINWVSSIWDLLSKFQMDETKFIESGYEMLKLRFNKISLLRGYHGKMGWGAKAKERGDKTEGDFPDNSYVCV